MAKVKVIRTITTRKEMKDLKGWTIPKGTVLRVVKELERPARMGGGKTLLVRVDNGTGHWDLCTETVIIMPTPEVSKR